MTSVADRSAIVFYSNWKTKRDMTETPEKPESDEITPKEKPKGLKSPTVISLYLAGWLVFICLWLPLGRGCGGTIHTPIDELKLDSIANVGDLISSFVLLGSYSNGLLIAVLVSIAAWMVSEKLWRFTFIAQFLISLSIGIVLVFLMLWHSGSAKEWLENCLYSCPALFGFGMWVGLAMKRKEYPVAWARLQHVWTIAALFYVHLLMLFKSEAMYGYWLTLIGLLGMVTAVELARYRMQHDLWDASQRVVRPQFTIRRILIWTAFFPIVFSYYRAIEPFCNWLYK